MAAVGMLADDFDASLLATGSRFATFSKYLCAFVVSEGGKIAQRPLGNFTPGQGLDQPRIASTPTAPV